MIQATLAPPSTPPADSALMLELLKAIAAKDHARSYDLIDLLIDPDDAPCRIDGGYQPRKAPTRWTTP